MVNDWLASNGKQLADIKHHLIELELQRSHDEVPLRPILTLFNGLEAEIVKLQNELNLRILQLKEPVDGEK